MNKHSQAEQNSLCVLWLDIKKVKEREREFLVCTAARTKQQFLIFQTHTSLMDFKNHFRLLRTMRAFIRGMKNIRFEFEARGGGNG